MSFSAVINLDRKPRARPQAQRLVVAVWAGLAGCRNSDSLPALPVYEVKGKVLLADGKPLRGGLISFVPKGDLPVTPSGVIASDGTFSLVTGGSGDGAPPGDYKVRVEAPQFQWTRVQEVQEAALSVQIHRRGQLGPRHHGASRHKSVGTDPVEVMALPASDPAGPVFPTRRRHPGRSLCTCCQNVGPSAALPISGSASSSTLASFDGELR